MRSLKLKVESLKLLKSLIHHALFYFLLFTIHYSPLTSVADAAYRVYLKNGSVIKGVNHYEKAEGEIRFYFGGGMVGVQETDILKIESTEEPVKDITLPEEPSAVKPEPMETEKRDTIIKDRAKEIPLQEDSSANIRNEISKKEAELKKIAEDYNKTMVRIQSLYLKSSKGTITDDERSMLQQNMIKKRKLEGEKKKLEDELKTLKGQVQ